MELNKVRAGGRTYNSVEEMVDDMSDPEFAAQFRKAMERKGLISLVMEGHYIQKNGANLYREKNRFLFRAFNTKCWLKCFNTAEEAVDHYLSLI